LYLTQVRQNYDRSGFFCHKSRVHAFQLFEMIITDTLYGQCSDPHVNIFIVTPWLLCYLAKSCTLKGSKNKTRNDAICG